ncbi:hypothetical protein ACS0TY_014128 [Phlomoides rotata]
MNSDSALLSATSSHSGFVDDDDSYLDGCSICLEPFTSVDPPSVTKCKHEYHLHCILDWSQRRIECPVCLRHLVLNDPASQELLASVEREKNLRSRRTFNPENQGNEVDNESDDEQPLMRQVSAIASRARNLTRRRREMIPTYGPSQVIPSVPSSTSNVILVNGSSHEHQNLDSYSSDSSPSPNQNPGKSSSSEFSAFSESLKSKISIASIRYKESISKSTHSLKEKLIARNGSVKELSRGVQREMSAGIAGIARMIAQKRGGVSVPSSNGTTVTQDGTAVLSPWLVRGETSKEMNSNST